MSILKRVRTILASNIHAKVTALKNPETEISMFIREMERDLREFTAESEAALAGKHRIIRELETCQAEVNKMERYAVKALEMVNEDKARSFLIKKADLKIKVNQLEKQLELASIKAEQMKLVQEKLESDVRELRNRRDELVGRLTVAESKRNVFEKGPSQSNVRLTTFDRLEEQANRALAEAEALEELKRGIDVEIENIDKR
ncbi:PspA/IM30 family protein [Ornithinibacillus californiensis]|uniref:PspA/IM30 family protein n=1 Tax=Ornithinibacillus californiensis TaxID=161536 RepID=UPI00069F41EE|nr:PspA/IM30 family protein [Ornithinibacillus californiensis]